MVTRRLKKQSIDDNSGTATTFSSSPSPSSSSSSSYSALACARSIRTARGRRRWRRLQLAAVAFLVLLPNNKSSNLTFATTLSSSNHEKKSENIHAWTICHNHNNNNNNDKNHKEENEEESTSSQREWIPPSQWDPVTFQRECFLERFTASTTTSHGSSAGSSSFSSSSSVSSPVVVTISAPGTALFQHWLSDHSSIHNHTTSTTPKNTTAKQFNPWNDFPTQETMQSYPDIGTINDDYYTLWYTTRISIPSQRIIEKEKKKKKKKKNNYIPDAIIESDGSSNSQKILVTDSIHNDFDDQHDSTTTTDSVSNIQQQQQHQQHQQHENKQRKLRGHLTMQGVNYLPLVHLDGKLIGTYSSHAEDEDASSSIGIGKNVGGMFLRRHYDLGIWNAATITTTSSLPLEILVLPPPVVGNPATTHSHDSTAAATTSATTQQATMKKMNMEEDRHLSPQLRNRNPHFDHPHDSFHSKKQKSPSFHQQPQPQPKQEPEGQGGDHNLAQSGAIMQCTAGWDWISSTPDRNTGIWDQVEIEWVWGGCAIARCLGEGSECDNA